MRTAAQFKKAFEAYIAKPATERNPAIEAALKQSSETAAVEREAAVAKRDKLKLELKQLIAKKPLSGDGAAEAKELDAELIVALKTGDYTGAMALMDEIKALVTDDTGETTDALKTLRDTRTAEVDKVFTALGLRTSTDVDGDKPPVEKTTAEARKAKSDDKFPDLKNLMAKRGEAVAWQQDEIATVDKATEELDRLGKVWQTLLDGIMEKRADVTAALDAQAKTDNDIASSEASEREERETKKEAEDMLLTTPLEKQARLQNSIKACDETIAMQQAAQVELKKLKAAHPQTVAAAQSLLDGAVNTAQATLTSEATKIADAAKAVPKGAPKQGMGAKNASDLLVKLGLSLVPELDIVALKDVSAEPDAKTLEISKVFPEMHLVAEKHGTGRHGVQTGLDRQAGRVNSGLSPDQTGDEGGLGEDLFEKGKNPKTGKDGFVDKARDPTRKFRLEGTQTASAFLSPELEKQAVDTAIKIVTAQCKWAEYQDGAGWKKITNILVELGPPAGVPGWGVAISRIDGDGKTDPAEVTKTLDDFRNGKLNFDAMLKKLNAKLSGPAKTDVDKDGVATVYVDCNFVTGVSVAVNRVGAGWINTSQWPTPPPATPAAWSLKNQMVRIQGDAGAGEVCAEPVAI